jgi:hypothetical protein
LASSKQAEQAQPNYKRCKNAAARHKNTQRGKKHATLVSLPSTKTKVDADEVMVANARNNQMAEQNFVDSLP